MTSQNDVLLYSIFAKITLLGPPKDINFIFTGLIDT